MAKNFCIILIHLFISHSFIVISKLICESSIVILYWCNNMFVYLPEISHLALEGFICYRSVAIKLKITFTDPITNLRILVFCARLSFLLWSIILFVCHTFPGLVLIGKFTG